MKQNSNPPFLKPSSHKRLLRPPQGLYDLSYAVLENGLLAILRSDCDALSNWQHNLKSNSSEKPLLFPDAQGFLYLSDGDLEWPVFNFKLETPFPLFDCLPDEFWIFVKPFSRKKEANGVFYDSSGKVQSRVILGNAVEHIQTDQNGSLWLGYFDQGFLQEGGWPIDQKDTPKRITGLMRFDKEGKPQWASPKLIMDCYALNCFDNECWVYSYRDFKIAQIKNETIIKEWATDIRGARALACLGSYILLAGGYGEEWNRLTLLELKEAQSISHSRGIYYTPFTEPLFQTPSFIGGRGSALHIIMGHYWTSYNLRDIIK